MPDYFIGLDLGQKHDFSTFAVLEKHSGAVARYQLRQLERLDLNTPYPVVASAPIAQPACETGTERLRIRVGRRPRWRRRTFLGMAVLAAAVSGVR
jgi:hypothetical protein